MYGNISLKLAHETLKTVPMIRDLISLQMQMRLLNTLSREPLSRKKKILTQKPKISLTISNRNAFSKASHKRTFLGETYQNTPTMMLTWKPPERNPVKMLLRLIK